MMNTRSPRTRVTARRLGNGAILAALAIATQVGCGREFYRDWANQDVSEAVFEKSRDPRWRLDVFSVEPPALSRYADPYDQEVPPAPPDDPAAEALSPVPQWPDNRLLIPAEGTGYQELLDKWRRDAEETHDRFLSPNTGVLSPGGPDGPPQPPGTPSPFLPPSGVPDGNQPPGGVRFPRGSQPPPTTPPASVKPLQTGPQSRNQVPAPSIRPTYSCAQARYQAQPASATQASYQAQAAKRTAKTPEKVVRLPEKPAAPTTSAQPPSVSQSPGGGPSRIGPQAWRDARPIGVLRITSGTIVRLQDGPTTSPPSPAFQKADRTDRSNRNSGPNSSDSTPISVSKVNPNTANSKIPAPRSAGTLSILKGVGAKDVKDKSVKPAAFQNVRTAAQPAPDQGAGTPANRLGNPSPGQEPIKRSDVADPLSQPPSLEVKQIEEAGKMSQQEAAELSGTLVPFVALQTDERGYGYPKGSRPYKINMQQAWVLALMNARFYQYNLETVYEAALPVTLQRFSYDPQFYAGMSPSTSVPQTNFNPGVTGAVNVGFPATPGVTASNSYTYATRFAPSGALSTLNLGTVAGVGKLFSSGGQLVMGFANEVMFNFLGKNSSQPSVISALPISFVQPLLRGGGRAVTLEPLTQAERNLLYAVRSFGLFRQQFFVATLTGGTVQNFGVGFNLPGFSVVGGDSDPVIGYLIVVFNLVEIEIDRRNLAFFENLVTLYSELIQGESSGLSQLQVDQVMQRLITARQALFTDEVTYRLQLDEFKMQMGLPPDLPLVVDMSLAQPFYDVFNTVDAWQRRANRRLDELPSMIAKLPELEDIDVEGRSVLGPYRNYRSTLQKFVPETEEGLEDVLQSAVRIALEYRLDMMNFRAALYDSWRQIRVTANALKGILNVAVTNNVYAPIASPNPFDFLSQARQFSLAFNAELPLVRVAERNNFRTALISYQRQRRSLQNSEDNLKVQLRNDLRNVHAAYIAYEIAKRNFELNVRLKDQAFEQIVAPPAGGQQALAQSANAATQTTNLLGFQTALIGAQLALTNGWQAYQTARLIVYRDIGILPYDEWEAFSELYPTQYHGPIIGHTPPGGPGFTAPPEARTATPESR
jgi:hypothetical protein